MTTLHPKAAELAKVREELADTAAQAETEAGCDITAGTQGPNVATPEGENARRQVPVWWDPLLGRLVSTEERNERHAATPDGRAELRKVIAEIMRARWASQWDLKVLEKLVIAVLDALDTKDLDVAELRLVANETADKLSRLRAENAALRKDRDSWEWKW